MFKNESILDRILRLLAGLLLTVLYFGGVVLGFWGIVLLVIGALLVMTGAIGYSFVYSMIGFHSNKKKKQSI